MAAAKETHHLPAFKRLGEETWLFNPEATHLAQQRNGDPDVILLGSWMGARLKNVAKYTEYYQSIYPASPILLMTSSISDFFFNTDSKQRARYEPAFNAIRALTEQRKNGMLVHTFSNGGTGQVCFMAKQYLKKYGETLPVKTVIFDSAPGRARIKQGVTSMSMGMPKLPLIRIPLQIFIAVSLFLFYLVPQAVGIPNLAEVMRMDMISTDPEVFPKDAKRVYIYSDADEQILYTDVEEHAKEAKEKGLKVMMERFSGSAHVDHMRKQPDHYWAVVKKAWDITL